MQNANGQSDDQLHNPERDPQGDPQGDLARTAKDTPSTMQTLPSVSGAQAQETWSLGSAEYLDQGGQLSPSRADASIPQSMRRAQADISPHTQTARPFPPALLEGSKAERIAFFQQVTLAHPELSRASLATLAAIADPAHARTINVIGPSGVGKTTLAIWLRRQLLEEAREEMEREPGIIPCVSVDATAPTSGRFDWMDYYRAVLQGLGDPFASGRSYIRTRDLRTAMERALRLRSVKAILIDEAQHLAKVASGRKLQDQLDHLKYLGDQTGVVHVLLGTYEMRPFRTVNAQLGRRSLDIHFRRYDNHRAQDVQVFRQALRSFQRYLPLWNEPDLASTEWEYLYLRSIGCIGTLKDWLARALSLAIEQQAKSLTHAHLKATAPSMERVEAAFNEAQEGESELREAPDADTYLANLIGLPTGFDMSRTGQYDQLSAAFSTTGPMAPAASVAAPGALGAPHAQPDTPLTRADSQQYAGAPDSAKRSQMDGDTRPARKPTPFTRKPGRDPIGRRDPDEARNDK